jgi:hypothetical protein
MRKLLFISVVFSLVLFSCDFNSGGLAGNFWAINLRDDRPYRVDAELLYTGTHCDIWAEKGSGITLADAQQFANEYDANIYQKMIDAFGLTNFTYYGYGPFSDTMKFADWMGDVNGRLCILLLDIKDDYKKDVNESYVAGYFWGGDLQNVRNSNLRDMIYIDTYPGLSTLEERKTAYKTLAHEMQHLMNFVTSFAKRSHLNGSSLSVSLMDEWIDEGLSSAAEYVYNGHTTDRISWFKNNGGSLNSLINRGNNFFVWGNRVNESQYAHLDDYSTVYLFFQWLRLQRGNTGIYRDIIASSYFNHLAVVNAINYSDWETLLKTWMAANYINASTGQYGYRGETAFNGMKAPSAPAGTTSLNLYPGEGVYSITNSAPALSGQGANIRNTFLSAAGVNDSAFSNGGALLTYNINTNIANGLRETGVTTGVAANQITRTASGVQAVFSGPFVIDARDLSGIGGGGGTVDFSLPLNKKGLGD